MILTKLQSCAIQPGKLAGFIAVSGGPVEDLSELERVIFVMKGGAVVKAP